MDEALIIEDIKKDLFFIVYQLEFATCTRDDGDIISEKELEDVHQAAKKDVKNKIKDILVKLNKLLDA